MSRIFGFIGVVWGGGILWRRFFDSEATVTGGAYAAGQSGATLFGALMAIVGIYYLVRKNR